MLSMYEYEWQFRPAKQMEHVDALSRLPLEEETSIDFYSINRLSLFGEADVNVEKVAQSLQEDNILGKVYKYTAEGWPNINKKAGGEITYYYNLRLKFNTQDNCLFYEDRLVIPKTLQNTILSMLHKDHEGIVRMKLNARSIFWWKNMNVDIENVAKVCDVCQVSQNVKKEHTVSSWPEVKKPMERIHLDLFYFQKYTLLIIVDVYSKFIDVKILNKSDVHSLISQIQQFFSYFGLASEIVTDNGPPFNSWKLETFCRENNIKLTKTPPYHPQSNTYAERSVQTAKKYFYKYVLDKKLEKFTMREKIIRFTSAYNSTPSSVTGESPTDRIFSFKVKTCVNIINHRYHAIQDHAVTVNKKVRFNLNENKGYSKKDRETPIVQFKKGEKVFYRNHFKSYLKWLPATVVRQLSRVVYVISLNNVYRTAHVNQIRYRKPATEINFNKIPSSQRNENNVEDSSEAPIFRRSTRVRKIPKRYL